MAATKRKVFQAQFGFCDTVVAAASQTAADTALAHPETARAFARDVCTVMAAEAPDHDLTNRAAVAPLSPRGRPGAPVGLLATWSQVETGADPSRYSMRTVPTLLNSHGVGGPLRLRTSVGQSDQAAGQGLRGADGSD